MIRFEHYPSFSTFTNFNWLRLLEKDSYKEIIIHAIKTRVDKQELTVYGFVIMPNHVHLILQLHDGVMRSNFQRDFLKYTAKELISKYRQSGDSIFDRCFVNDSDRAFQIWERNSLHIDLFSERVFMQKLSYIHHNPIKGKWQLANSPQDYYWSSARFYDTGIDDFGILTHWRE